MSHLHLPLPDKEKYKKHKLRFSDKDIKFQIQHMAACMRENKSETHHVPELVECHNKARAHASHSLEGPDVNFDPYPLLNASVQLPQWTAFTY